MAKKISTVQIASATVIEGEGFWVSAARAALAGIYFLSSTRMPNRAFATVGDGVAWVAGYVPHTLPERMALLAAATEVRKRHLAL